MYLNWGDPKVVERLMATVRAYDRIIAPNPAGHLHFRTSWYSGSKVYSEGPWEWGKAQSYLVLHPGLLLGAFNGDPTARKYVTGLADGLLAHARDGGLPDDINWRTDATRGTMAPGAPPLQLLWGAWRFTGDQKYLAPVLALQGRIGNRAIADMNENVLDVLDRRTAWSADAVKKAGQPDASNFDRYLAWQVSGDRRFLEDLYGEEIRSASQRMYTQTEGHWWSDRVEIPSELLQRSRLGGVALKRNWLWPGATVSWRFAEPDAAEQVAILVRGATPTRFEVTAYNTTARPIVAAMTGWNVAPGQWRMTGGTDTRTFAFEKSASTDVAFPPGETTLAFERISDGPAVEARPDLGIGPEDIKRTGRSLTVTVHSLGAADAPAGTLTVEDAAGRVLATATTPRLKAPRDLLPKTAVVKLTLPAGAARIRVAMPSAEITQLNNTVALP